MQPDEAEDLAAVELPRDDDVAVEQRQRAVDATDRHQRQARVTRQHRVRAVTSATQQQLSVVARVRQTQQPPEQHSDT